MESRNEHQIENRDEFDFTTICRSCLSYTNDMLSIFSEDSMERNFSQLFVLCAGLEISPMDGLPRQICQSCANQLLSLSNFRQKCIQSNAKLVKYLKKCTSKNKSSENEPFNESAVCGSKNELLLPRKVLELQKTIKQENVEDCIETQSDCADECKEDLSENDVPLAKILASESKAVTLKISRKRGRPKKIKEKLPAVVHSSIILEAEEKDSFKCIICSRVFTSKLQRTSHRNIHFSFSCKSCKKKYETVDEFKNHTCEETDNSNGQSIPKKHAVEDAIKVLRCHLCERQYKHVRSLRNHLRTHTGEKPSLCTWCGKSFYDSRALVNHVRAIHTQEKRYKCSFCSKAFPVSGKRRQHERVHTGEKPYQCEICWRLFAARTTLKAHVRRHTHHNNLHCTLPGCGKGFYTFSSYQRHMWAHRGERPYKCDICQKTYLSSQNLQSHVKAAHTNQRDQICHVCSKGYNEKSVLNRHLRKIHNIEPKQNKPVPSYGFPLQETSEESKIKTN